MEPSTVEAVDRESSGPWKLWTMEALDRVDRCSSEPWKPCTVEELDRGNYGLRKPWAMKVLDRRSSGFVAKKHA